MKDNFEKSVTTAYLKRSMPDSLNFNPVKAAKIYNRFENPIKKQYEEMEEAKPEYRRVKKFNGGKISLKDCKIKTSENNNSKHKNCW
jgi:hypothetical protein